MRPASCLIAISLFAHIVSMPAAAQQRPPMPPCDGVMDIVRVSTIKPGKVDTFLQAVAAQKAWYQKQGASDEITLIRVLDTKTGAYSTTEAITSHTEPAGEDDRRKSNAGFDAFVALFRESSDVKQQYIGCKLK